MLNAIRLVGAVVPVAAAMLLLVPQTAEATTGGCFVSSIAADEFENFFFGGVDLSETKKRCKSQCDDFLAGCLPVVSASHSCTKAGLQAFFDGIKRECGDIEDDVERQACKSATNEEEEMILGFLSGEKKTGKQSCKGTYEECYAVCKGEIIMEAAER